MGSARFDADFLYLNGQRYPIALEEHLRGRRGISRDGARVSQLSDPSRLQQADWTLTGPLGNSREGPAGVLGIDYATLEHRYDGLLTSPAEANSVDLTGFDAPGSGRGDSLLPKTLPFLLDGAAATSPTIAAPISFFHEDRGDLFAARGNGSTQVRPDTMVAVATETFDAKIKGAAVWFAKGYYGFGDDKTMQRRATVSLHGGATYEDVTASSPAGAVKTSAMTVGADRLWMVRGDAGASTQNRIRFTFDAVDNLSNPFIVGDPLIDATGIGAIGPFVTVGSEIGAFSFTEDGRPVRVIESVKDARSVDNATQMASLFGWQYIITEIGLLAIIPGEVENHVGPGSEIGFEGPTGKPTAVAAYKNSIWLAERVGDDTYIWRGLFGPETRATGKPDWYFWAFLSGSEVRAISGTGLRGSPTLLSGENDNMRWFTLATRDREIADQEYRFGITGGDWFGTALTRNPSLHKVMRMAMVLGENIDANNNYQLATSADEGEFVDFGNAISASGHQIIRPVSGGAPQSALGFHTLKPRLRQVADNNVTPPSLRNGLTIVYDERPELVEEIVVVLVLGAEGRDMETEWNELKTLVGHTQTQPVVSRLPTDLDDIYTHVVGVDENRDLDVNGVMGVNVRLLQWRVA
jgi:hypothetical protein